MRLPASLSPARPRQLKASQAPPYPPSRTRPLAFPCSAIQRKPTPGRESTETPIAYVANTVLAPIPPNPRPFNIGTLVLVAIAMGAGVLLLVVLGQIIRKAVPRLLEWAAKFLRTRSGRIVASGLLLVGVAFVAFQMAFAPVWPIPPNSATAKALWDVYGGAQAAENLIHCQDEPVTLLADYYADTPDYGKLSTLDHEWIVKSFGPAALSGAGALTIRQANYIVVFGAIPAADVANPLGLPRPSERWPCVSGGSDVGAAPIRYWTNSAVDLAVVRYMANGCSNGQFDVILRKLDGQWKIVAQRVHRHCVGMG